jgi:hypothetical protein
VSEAYSSGFFYAGQIKPIEIPKLAKNIQLKLENMVFIGIWKTVYQGEIIPTIPFCLSVGGTTLNPTIAVC